MPPIKYFQIAQELNQAYQQDLKANNFHFRGNQKSFALISLDAATPEIGFPGLKTKKAGIQKLEQAIGLNGQEKIELTNGRDGVTKEKALQAWLINHALNHHNKLYFDPTIEFLTSELALFYDNGHQPNKRIVTDILGIDQQQNLVIIELKSRRDKTRLINQVNNFEEAINQQTSTIHAIVEVFQKKWSGKIRKLIVWPYATNGNASWSSTPDIVVYEYQEVIAGEMPYTFEGLVT